MIAFGGKKCAVSVGKGVSEYESGPSSATILIEGASEIRFRRFVSVIDRSASGGLFDGDLLLGAIVCSIFGSFLWSFF